MSATAASIPAIARQQCTLEVVDYEDAFEVYIANARQNTAAQWMRAIFIDAPQAIRTFIDTAWCVMQLKSWNESFEQALSSRIISHSDDVCVIIAHSDLMGIRVCLVMYVLPSSVGIATFVQFEKKWRSGIAWRMMAAPHRWFVPYLLTQAAARKPQCPTAP